MSGTQEHAHQAVARVLLRARQSLEQRSPVRAIERSEGLNHRTEPVEEDIGVSDGAETFAQHLDVGTQRIRPCALGHVPKLSEDHPEAAGGHPSLMEILWIPSGAYAGLVADEPLKGVG
jgi:hypothetical protein